MLLQEICTLTRMAGYCNKEVASLSFWCVLYSRGRKPICRDSGFILLEKGDGVLFLGPPYPGTFCRRRGLKSVPCRINLPIFIAW